MTFNILWPAMRWPDNREIEIASVGEEERTETLLRGPWEKGQT